MIAQRLGDDFDISKSPHIMVHFFAPYCRLQLVSSDLLCHIDLGMQYEDDEGDRVILATDNDLINAITYARSSGAKVL